MSLLSIFAIRFFSLIVCSGIHRAEGECNYLYDTVPASSNYTTCTISKGGTVYFSCVVYDRCNSISMVSWYKSRNVGGRSEHVTRSPDLGGKHQIFSVHVTANDSNLDGYCSTASFLVINSFNHNDSGYYWCQILANGSLLLPSPYGYVSVNEEGDHPCGVGDLNDYPSPRLCAEYPLPTESSIFTTTMMIILESTQHEYNINGSDSVISKTTLSGTTASSKIGENGLLYGTIIGILLSVIVLILVILMCLAIIRCCKSCQKREYAIKECKLAQLERSQAKETVTVSNPHYRKITHLLAERNPEYESSKSKQLATFCDSEHHKDEREYATLAIDSTQMETKEIISANMTLSEDETYEECIQLSQNVAYSPLRVWSKRSENLPAVEHKSSPSSHNEYDEVSRDLQDLKKHEDTTRHPSPEYAEIISKDKYQKAEIVEQHYYHSPDIHDDTKHYYSSIAEMAGTVEIEHNTPQEAQYPLTDGGISIVGVNNMSYCQNDLTVVKETRFQ